jgi:hypothetical protein
MYLFVHHKDNPQRPPTKVKRKKMQIALKNRKKVVANFPRSVLKRNNRIEEGDTSGLKVKRE